MRDRFEILAIHHSDDVLTVRDLDGALYFKGGRLPFPVIIDEEGKTFDAYGLERGAMFRSAPSQFLIDPDGRVVSGCFSVLAELILRLMEK